MAKPDFEYGGFEEQRRIKRRRRNRIALPIVMLLCMLAALVSIAIYDYHTMRSDALVLSKGVVINLQSRIETEMDAFLGRVPAIVQLSRDLLAAEQDRQLQRQLAESLGISTLNNTAQLTAFFIGTADGHFLMVRRYSAEGKSGLETKLIRPSATDPAGLEIELTRRGEDGAIAAREIKPWDQYDPRKRPWYQGAIDRQGIFWTDVYPFFTGQTAGVTASMPLLDETGTLQGVIGVDVALDSISHFLASLSIGKTGFALIVDGEGRLIAHPHAEPIQKDSAGKLRLTLVDDLDNPLITRAFDRNRIEGHGRRDFALDGRRYISSSSSLSHLLNRDWSVLVVVPEDDFVGFVVDNVGKTLLLGMAVIALAALLAAFLIREGLRADRAALDILERAAELDAQGEAFGRLAASTAESGNWNDVQTLAQVTEAVAQATGVDRVSIWHLQEDESALLCIDCFDRDAAGHTQGSRLDGTEHRLLIDALKYGDAVAAVDAAGDPRSAPVFHHYLGPVGCRALLAAPIRVGDIVTGTIWLEDSATRSAWTAQTSHFLHAIANLLALHRWAPVMSAATSTLGEPPAPAATGQRVSPLGLSKALDTSLDRQRAAAFTARLVERTGSAIPQTPVFDRLAVMVIRFTDPTVLAGPAASGRQETMVAHLLRGLQAAATRIGIAYLKFLSDRAIASVDPDTPPEQGLAQITEFAIAARMLCETALGGDRSRLPFRIGIDFGPAIGGLVGHEHPLFELWGEAVQTATTMANTGLPGGIQTTETVYLALRDRFLFQLRGHHYAERVGEFSTYLLEGRL